MEIIHPAAKNLGDFIGIFKNIFRSLKLKSILQYYMFLINSLLIKYIYETVNQSGRRAKRSDRN